MNAWDFLRPIRVHFAPVQQGMPLSELPLNSGAGPFPDFQSVGSIAGLNLPFDEPRVAF